MDHIDLNQGSTDVSVDESSMLEGGEVVVSLRNAKIDKSDKDYYRHRWAQRTLYTDWCFQWLNDFVAHCQNKPEIQPEDMQYISESEQAHLLYQKWCVEMRLKG